MYPVIPPKISKYFFKIYGKIVHVANRNSKEGVEQQVDSGEKTFTKVPD